MAMQDEEGPNFVTRADRFTRKDLIDAWLAARHHEHAHDDLRSYASRRSEALQAAFDVRLDELPDRDPDLLPEWVDADGTEDGQDTGDGPTAYPAFSEAAEVLLAVHSPLSGYLAVGPAVGALIDRHGAAIDVELARLRAALQGLLLDAMELVWGLGPDASVDASELLKHGFDPADTEPDPDDYW